MHVLLEVKKGFPTLTTDRHGMSWLVRAPFVEAEFAVCQVERWVAWQPICHWRPTVASSQKVRSSLNKGSQAIKAFVTYSPTTLVLLHLWQWGPCFLFP